MPTLFTGTTLPISVAAGQTLVLKELTGTATATGATAAREDAAASIGAGFVVYGPQPSASTVSLTTTGICEWQIVSGDATPAKDAFRATPYGAASPDSLQVLANSGFGKLPRALRAVSTKCGPPTNRVIQPKFGGRIRMVATETLYTMSQVLSAWYMNGSAQTEDNLGNAISYRSSVEYPIGFVRQPFTLAGNQTMVCPDGEDILTDNLPLAVPIPAGAVYFIVIYGETSGAGYMPYHTYLGPADISFPLPVTVSPSGEGFTLGSGSVDNTQTLANPIHQSITINWRPTAVLSYTTNHALALVGDSRTAISATFDAVNNSLGTQGQLERLVNGRRGTINLAIPGDGINKNLTNFVKRRRLLQYCSIVMNAQGINDAVSLSRTGAQMLADMATFETFIGDLPLWVCTVYPRAGDTVSGFTSSSAQTVDASNTAVVDYNRAVRQGQVGDVCIEIADLVTSSRDSGVFKVVSRVVTDAAITGTALTSASARFSSSDRIPDARCVFLGAGTAGGAHSFTLNTITNATTAVASASAPTTVASGGTLHIGTITYDGLHLLTPGLMQIQENGKLPQYIF